MERIIRIRWQEAYDWHEYYCFERSSDAIIAQLRNCPSVSDVASGRTTMTMLGQDSDNLVPSYYIPKLIYLAQLQQLPGCRICQFNEPIPYPLPAHLLPPLAFRRNKFEHAATGRGDNSLLRPWHFRSFRTPELRRQQQEAGHRLACTVADPERDPYDIILCAIRDYDITKPSKRILEIFADEDIEKCEECSTFDYSGDLNDIGNRKVCDSCLENNYTDCEDCGSIVHNDSTYGFNDRYVCEACFEENYTTCGNCGEDCHRDEMRTLGRRWMCECCYDNHDHDSGCVYIGEYHSTAPQPIPPIPRDSAKVHVCGLELELSFSGYEDRDAFAESIHYIGKAGCELDSSIDGAGVEVVTDYGTLPALLPLVQQITREARGYGARSHDTTCCGLHISLQRQHFTTLDIAKIVSFWNSPGNNEFLRIFTRRNFWSNNFCETKGEKTGQVFIDEAQRTGFSDNCKYEVVNLCHSSHLEFRGFRGSTRYETVAACISLVSKIADFCRQTSHVEHLTAGQFSRFIMEGKNDKRTKRIKTYITERTKRADSGRCKPLQHFATL